MTKLPTSASIATARIKGLIEARERIYENVGALSLQDLERANDAFNRGIMDAVEEAYRALFIECNPTQSDPGDESLVTLSVATAKIEKDIKNFKSMVYRQASEAKEKNVYAYLADKIASKSDILDASKQQFEKDGWSEKDFVLQYIKESNYLA